MKLTTEEKLAVLHITSENLGFWATISAFWPYLLPLVFGAAYSVFSLDILMAGFTFIVIFLVIIWYLHQSAKSAKALQSALIKYRDEVDLD